MLPIAEPGRTAGGREMLQGFLDLARATVLWKLDGVADEDARAPAVPSGTSLLGIVKHLAYVELWWFSAVWAGEDVDFPWSDDDPDADWRIEPDETVDGIRALYVDAVGRANAAVAAEDRLDEIVERGGRSVSLRWIVVHMIEETARHTGHADVIREQIDGVTGYLPPRPETPSS